MFQRALGTLARSGPRGRPVPGVLRPTRGHAPFSAAAARARPRRFLRLGGRVYANPKKFEQGNLGEDAFFLCDPVVDPHDSWAEPATAVTHQAFGVADGVGDWVFLRGVDSALYSRDLMALAKQYFCNAPAGDVHAALRHSYERIKELETQGSSTICLANFDCETSRLSVANLGDSGLFVVRGGELAFQTRAQNHIFGVPFQLSSDYHHSTGSSGCGYELAQQALHPRTPDRRAAATAELQGLGVAQLKDQLRASGLPVSGRKAELVARLVAAADHTAGGSPAEPDTRGKFYNLPEHADVADVQLQPGDLVVAATDGFFDNLDAEEAASDIWKMRAMDTSQLAKTIARHALEVSRGAVRGVVDTPFSRQAAEEMNMVFHGGKLDDITVVVAKVFGPHD